MSATRGSAPRIEPVLRETVLWRFRDPEHIETLRRFGDLLYSMAAETFYWGATHGWSPFQGEANAAAADLEHVADFLEAVAELPDDARLAGAAVRWAEELRRLVEGIREVVGEPEGEEERE
jgi:hypothetical protein